MNVRIHDLMADDLVTASPNDAVADVRGLMERHGIHAVPVVGDDDAVFGIVTSADLVHVVDGSLPIARVATRRVHTLPRYADISDAARLMRRQHIHHVLVTHEKKLVGILSSFDLLQLVENHRFAMKAGPTPRRKSRRDQA